MKIKITFLLILFLVLAIPSTAFAKSLFEDKVIFGQTFTLENGETLEGNLVAFGGVVTLEESSIVKGDVVLIGSTLTADGTIDGNLVGLGGVVTLQENAVVEGNLSVAGVALEQDENARIEGQVITGFQIPFNNLLPGPAQVPPSPTIIVPESPRVEVHFSPFWFLFRTFLWAAISVLLVMFLPKPTERTAQAIVDRPVLAGAIGLLTAFVAPLLLIVTALTLILIPISLVGVLILVIAWFLGRIALGYEVGRRLNQMFRKDWPLPIAAGIGTFIFALVVDGVGSIPCVGWILPAIVGILGLGGVLLTRFGTQTFPPFSASDVSYPVAPIVPVSPVSPQESTINTGEASPPDPETES